MSEQKNVRKRVCVKCSSTKEVDGYGFCAVCKYAQIVIDSATEMMVT